MKILIVSQNYWPEVFRINDLAAGLVERGHAISVLTGIPNYPFGRFFKGYGLFRKRKQIVEGVSIARVPLVSRGQGSAFRLVLNYLSFALSASIFGPFLCRDKYDLIFVFQTSPITAGVPALILKLIKKCPLVFWVQDLWPESVSATGFIKSPFLLNMIGKLVRTIYTQCDLILIQSRAFSASVQRYGADPKRIVYYPNSAEKIYRPIPLSEENEQRRNLPQGFRIIFAGNLGIAQDFETIISAADILKDYSAIHWIIIGDGSMKKWIEEELIRRGLTKSVHLLGRHPVEDMPEFFSLADALLVTLKRDPIFSITIPSKVQSYLACGRPIIAALDGEGRNLIEDAQAGVVCPPEEPKALAEAVLSLFHMNQSERDNMGFKGLEYFKVHFEREKLLSRLEMEMQLCRKG